MTSPTERFTIPPPTQVAGQGLFTGSTAGTGDVNDAWRALRQVGPANVCDKRFAGGADPAASADSTAAFQAAIDGLPDGGGPLRVPAGTYRCDAGKLRVRSGLQLLGDGYQCTRITCNGSSQTAPRYLFNMDPPAERASNVTDLHISGLNLDCTSADIFWGQNITRAKIVDNWLNQRSGDYRIWHSDAATGTVSGTQVAGYMAECEFSNRENVYPTTGRTVESWLIDCTNTQMACNDNTWHAGHGKLWVQPGAYWMKLIGGSGTATGSRHNTWRDLVFECPNGDGGFIWLVRTTHALIDNVSSQDQPSTTSVTNAKIRVGAPGESGCLAVMIHNYTRRAANGATATFPDIVLDSASRQVTITAPRGPASGGQALHCDLGDATGVMLDGAWPDNYNIYNRNPVGVTGPDLLWAHGTWVAPALTSGYTMGSPPLEARKMGVLMQVRGRVTPPASGYNNTIARLPADFPTWNRTQTLRVQLISPTTGVTLPSTCRVVAQPGANRDIDMYELPSGATSVEITGFIST